MTQNATLAVSPTQGFWDEKQVAALKQLGLGNVSKGDLAVLLHYSQKTGLDPFARQIYMIERGGKAQIQTSIDGFRIIAQRSGEYAGQTPTEWCGEDGVWKEVWLSKEFPSAARVGVYRKGFEEALYAIAKWDSYAVPSSPMWKKMPDLMLGKCAEALALRKAFPQDLSGIYTNDEMNQAEEPSNRFMVESPAIVVEAPAIPQAKAKKDYNPTDLGVIIIEVMKADNEDELRDIWKNYELQLDEEIGIDDQKVSLRDFILQRRKTLTEKVAS
jgi:phage recombination protein Bet